MSLLYSVLASTTSGSQIDAAIAAEMPDQTAGVWSVDPRGYGSANAVVTQNQAELSRVSLLDPVTIDTIRISVAVQNGNLDVGVYSFDGTTMTRKGSSGSTAVPAIGIQNVALTAPVTVEDGDYLAFACDSATAQFRQWAHVSGTLVGTPVNLSLLKAASFPLPATIATPSAGSRTILLVGVDL